MLYPYRGYSRFVSVFFVLFILAALSGVGYSAYRERAAQLTFQLQRAQGSVLMVEDQITQTFQLIESMVMTLPELSEIPLAHMSSSELTRLLMRLQLGQPAVRSLSVMTTQSVIKASTNSANVGMALSLDDYVPPDIDTAAVSVLRIGSVWLGRDFADGKLAEHSYLPDQKARSFLPLAFRIGVGADAVWVLAAINTDYLLDRMVRYTQIDSDQFALIRFDGHLLMRSVDDRASPSITWTEMLPEMRLREIGTHAGQQLTAYRASSRYPFFFAIHVDRDATLAQWTANFWVVVYWTGAALLGVMVVTLLLMRQIRMSEEAQRRQQAELTLSRDRAEAATLAKSQFLASMSHEIRTPMNGVLGMTELLANSGLTEEQGELLRVLQSSGRMLLTLIDDILDFSKIEMGKLELEKIPFDMQLLLIDLKDTFIIQAEAKGLELILAQTQYLPRFIKGDPTRLRQVFSNLIANAIKFTDEGKVSIDVKASEIEGEYEVIVQDTGIGIGSDVQKRLFTAFTQANSSITREYGGTGLGLAISAMLVQLMGGRIWLESELGKGSKFHFTFKAGAVTDEFVLSRPEAEPVTDLGYLKVLLAEDHQINRLLVSKMLNRVNIKPDLACDGLEALAYVQEKDYDVVLMDLQMPNIDGITATKKIRSNSKIHQPYIIALTANVFAENKAECYAVGMNDFISKPVNMESLVNALDKR